ncbi:MAG: copper chaperone PCu(A)C [Burkholderiales bacterium]
MLQRLTFLVTALLLAGAAQAQVTVTNAWVRGTATGQKTTGAFMTLTAPTDAKLVEVKSPAADIVEVHEMAMDNNVMKMRAVPALALPAGKAVELKPGGFHVMLIDLKQPLKAGDSVPLTLVIEGKDGKRETLAVKAEVRALGAPATPMDHKH